MGTRTIESLKGRLLSKQEELISAITRTVLDGRRSEGLDAQDTGDQANYCYNKESLFQRNSNDRDLLVLVQAALRRIDEGAFGLCVECGEPCRKKRLEAVPWARQCMACQELQEKGLL